MSARLDTFLEAAHDLGGSDLHLRPGHPPLVRVDEALTALPYRTLDATELEALVREIASDADWRALERDGTRVFAHDAGEVGRARVSLALHQGGLLAVLRRIPCTAPRLIELGVPRVIGDLVRLRDGLVLVTGPAGSGRTTTIAGMVRAALEQGEQVVTLESPIEFRHDPRYGHLVQRTIGEHVGSAREGLRDALGSGADMVVLGDLDDAATLAQALEVAASGLRVLATAPTRSATGTIDHLLDLHPSEAHAALRETLATHLRAIVSQQLVRSSDGRGRRAAHEILIVNDTVRPLLRDGRMLQLNGAMAMGKRAGMQLMDAAILALVRAGDVDPDAAFLHAQDPWAFAPFVTRPEWLALASAATRAA